MTAKIFCHLMILIIYIIVINLGNVAASDAIPRAQAWLQEHPIDTARYADKQCTVEPLL